MNLEFLAPQRTSFMLGPFEVLSLPLTEPSLYTLYGMMLSGVTVRRQISYPEEADGWIGYARMIAEKLLSPEEQETIREYCNSARSRKIKPVYLAMGPIRVPHGYAGRPKKDKPVTT